MKYKIAMTYAKEVDGEPVLVPGFEEIKMFIHLADRGKGVFYIISEVTTGLSMVHYEDQAKTKEEAISILRNKLINRGLKQVLESISKAILVEDLPMEK